MRLVPLAALAACVAALVAPVDPPMLLGVTTEVVAESGEAPYACRPVYMPPEARGPGGCLRVPVSGVDLDALADRNANGGRVTGTASLVGFYRAGTFRVVRQGRPGVPPDIRPPRPLPVSCPTAIRHAPALLCEALLDATEFRRGNDAVVLTEPVLTVAPDGAAVVAFDVVAMTEEVAAFVASYPPGTIRPRAWLQPL
jgi:hypothetical protein